MANANVEDRKESDYVDGFKASLTELLLVDKGNYTSSPLATVRMLCFGGEDDYNSTQNFKPSTKKEASRRRRQASPCSASSCSKHKKGKKTKDSPVSKPVRMGREKLGAHVKALQQLVSPMGKSDTASVLQEAFLCIIFLHEQIKVLSSAYVEARTGSAMEQVWSVAEGDLRRRGLCLVPVSRTEI